MHQSFDRGAFTLYATESKWILAKVNGMNSSAPICPTRTILPFFKKNRRIKNHVLQSSRVFIEWLNQYKCLFCHFHDTTKS